MGRINPWWIPQTSVMRSALITIGLLLASAGVLLDTYVHGLGVFVLATAFTVAAGCLLTLGVWPRR